MKKKFTAVVPDRLYFSEISGNTKVSFTYDGPQELKVNITFPNDPTILIDGDDFDEVNDTFITLDANTDLQAAYMLSPNPITVDNFVFEEEKLLDGTVYLNRTNPSLHDYYKIYYNTEKSSFEYTPISREWRTKNLVKAQEAKLSIETGMLARITIDNGGNEAVKQFLIDSGVSIGDLSAEEVVQQLQDYIKILDAYIIEESKIISWKYENGPPETQFPEIPEIIKKFF